MSWHEVFEIVLDDKPGVTLQYKVFCSRYSAGDQALLKSDVLRGLHRLFGKLRIDGRRQLAVTAYCVRSFFNTYLKGTSVSPLQIASPLYPEVAVLQ